MSPASPLPHGSASASPPRHEVRAKDRPETADAWRVARRSVQLAGGTLVFVGVFLGHASRRLARREPDALLRALGAALRTTFTRLGATFIKVGQIASTRGDLLPRAITTELAKLQDSVPAEDFDDVRRLLERELGGPIESRFADFDPVPVAAASVAQVHRARLPDGTVVAVKIRRPGIRRTVRLDRSILFFLTQGLERVVPSLRLVSLPEAVATFCDAVEVQLSLRREAEHNRRFTAMFSDDEEIAFPVLHDDLCTDALLTMDFVEEIGRAHV